MAIDALTKAQVDDPAHDAENRQRAIAIEALGGPKAPEPGFTIPVGPVTNQIFQKKNRGKLEPRRNEPPQAQRQAAASNKQASFFRRACPVLRGTPYRAVSQLQLPLGRCFNPQSGEPHPPRRRLSLRRHRQARLLAKQRRRQSKPKRSTRQREGNFRRPSTAASPGLR